MRAELCGPSSQVMALGIVPMCSYQMERMFNTTRIPGKETGTQHSRVRVGSPDQPLPPSCGPAGLCGLLPVRHQVSSMSQGCVTVKNSQCLSNVKTSPVHRRDASAETRALLPGSWGSWCPEHHAPGEVLLPLLRVTGSWESGRGHSLCF